jgi:hypothetical protein
MDKRLKKKMNLAVINQQTEDRDREVKGHYAGDSTMHKNQEVTDFPL